MMLFKIFGKARILMYVVIPIVASGTQPTSESIEPIYPTPIMDNINETVVRNLREQDMSNVISNTSFEDIYNDNNTQQLQRLYRERKKQERLLLIQREILHILGFSKEPNVTAWLSEEEKQRILELYDKRKSNDYDSNLNYTIFSSINSEDNNLD